MGPLVNNWDKLLPEILAPLHFPRHPLALSRFGFVAGQSAGYLIFRNFRTKGGKSLFAGMAAHSKMPLDKPGSAAFGLLLGAAGHAVGWPIVKGGSQTLPTALQQCFVAPGGEIKIGMEVRSLNELPQAKVILLDITLGQLASNCRNSIALKTQDSECRSINTGRGYSKWIGYWMVLFPGIQRIV